MVKTLIVGILVVLIGMGIGVGGWYGYKMYVVPEEPTDTDTDDEIVDSTPVNQPNQLGSQGVTTSFDVPTQQTRIPVSVLPRYVPGAEETEILARQLSDRQQSLELRDDRLKQKEAAMKLILEDFQSEQDLIAKLRVAVDNELQQVSRETIAQATAAVDAAADGGDAAGAGGAGGGPAVGAEEQANIRKLGLAYDTMPAQAAATIFIEMDKEGLTDTVVRLLSVMKDRTSARVLAEISNTDPELAASLTQELRQLKAQPAAAAQ